MVLVFELATTVPTSWGGNGTVFSEIHQQMAWCFEEKEGKISMNLFPLSW
jgi:hypothetical protein